MSSKHEFRGRAERIPKTRRKKERLIRVRKYTRKRVEQRSGLIKSLHRKKPYFNRT